MEEINVISGDLDGAELRREQHKNSCSARCDGKEDNEQIQDAFQMAGKTTIAISAEEWERIFGGK